MSDGSEVSQYGTDSSGRPILLTAYMADWFEGVCRELGFRPTIVQGAWMARLGGGADASAGYHDGGGCIDLRIWDRTPTQRDAMLHAIRWGGGATGWVRDAQHGGMDPHLHLVLGTDHGLATGAAWQWLNYLHGGDGLGDGSGRDYHPRPDPIGLQPRDDYLRGLYDMTPDDVKQIVAAAVEDAKADIAAAVWEYVVRQAAKDQPEQTAQAALKKAANRT